MEIDLPEIAEEPRRRRRRSSHRKSSKELHVRRRRLKAIGTWVLICLIGGGIVTAIAILAGESSG